LANRLGGFSFFITEEQVKTLPLVFTKGSKKRLLEIFELLRNEPAPITCNKTESVAVKQEYKESIEGPDDLPF